jgi:hypothetical protein
VPAGPLPLGLIYFAGVKLVGYTLAGRVLLWAYGASTPRPVLLGFARTFLGLVVGIAFAWTVDAMHVVSSEWSFYLLLLPVRVGEWSFVIWYFFRPRASGWRQLLALSSLGAVWSTVLDLPAILAVFTLPGGAWIC